MKVGWLGSFLRFVSEIEPKPESPRIRILGTELGFEPAEISSCSLKEGSNTCKALIKLVLETFSKSALATLIALPVKLCLFLV